MRIPCGQCMGCRLDRAGDWATRIAHEAQLHQANSFLTLTYSEQHLPEDLSLSVRHVQLFMKRLRRSLEPEQIRFFGCGEYGDKFKRPHYHLIIFGWDFPDKFPWRKTGSGYVVYRSPKLEQIWPFGHVEIGTVTTQSAGYVARYVTKKVHGDDEVAKAAYMREKVDPDTGEIRKWSVMKEFVVMSRKPGIGSGWFEQFACDAFPSDFVVIDGMRRRVPRYYTKKLLEEQQRKVKQQRRERAALHPEEQTDSRLITKHESRAIAARLLVRKMDEEQ